MSIRVATTVPFAVEEVFAFHEHRGALARLVPPWLPVRVLREAGGLRDGRAELRLPGGLTWTARRDDYDPPHRFVDRLGSSPLRWRHTHSFAAVGEAATRVLDEVDTPVPAALLRATFRYRHRQLADDLAAVVATRTEGPLTVAVTGSSGLVGQNLTALFGVCGWRVVRLVRRAARAADERQWRPDAPAPALLADVDAVVHLAGASIAGRFTARHKHAVRASRIVPTRRLAELAADRGEALRAFVCASAIGYYGADRGDERLDEHTARGDGFLADVVTDWEAATVPASEAGVRTVLVRTGIVQSPRGGALARLRPLFTAGLGGRLGDGRQWTSWIDLDDLSDIYLRALLDGGLAGPVNATAPAPVRNADYTRTLAAVLRRPAALPVPSFGPRLLLGREGAEQLALAGQCVQPARLTERGHRFRRPELAGCLRHQLGRLSA
jgi:uncharacterized protein (TIGR01777 family)